MGGGGTCDTTHDNGVGENYYDCSALYTNTNPWTAAAALEACTAYTGSSTLCASGYTCGTDQLVCAAGYFACDCWEYSGSLAGYVSSSVDTTCYCPVSFDPSWD